MAPHSEPFYNKSTQDYFNIYNHMTEAPTAKKHLHTVEITHFLIINHSWLKWNYYGNNLFLTYYKTFFP